MSDDFSYESYLEQLKTSAPTLDKLQSRIAHDIKNKVNGLMVYGAMIQDRQEYDLTETDITQTAAGIVRLSQQILDILNAGSEYASQQRQPHADDPPE